MQNLVAIEIRWQVGRRIRDLLHLQSLPTMRETIEKTQHHDERRNQCHPIRHHGIQHDEKYLWKHGEQYHRKQDPNGSLVIHPQLQSEFCQKK